MNNKVKFLRGTSGEYAVAEKDSDTIYFTTDDGKLYIGDKEISGDGSLTIDDTLSDTSTNPIQNKIVKQAIDNKADKTVATTETDGLMSAEDKGKLDNADDTYALKSKYGDTTINVGRKLNTTVGAYSTAEGYQSTASGSGSYAGGYQSTASGICSHAEGYKTTASGDYSHTCGLTTKALHSNEVAYGKYNESNDNTLFSIGDGTADDARHNAFEITTTGGKLHDKDIATTDLIPTTLPANGGNADTVDGLHADDFVNANDRDQIQIPSNVDVPVWIHTNGKRFQRYMTNGGNIGLTNVPDNSIDYVWYWYDGMNIIARDNSSRRYFICDMINGVFSGWKDIYTSGNKPYVTGVVVVDSNGKANVSFGFEPSFVLYEPTSPKSGIFGSVYSATTFNATGFTPSADTYTGGLTGNGFSYIAFK